ncbi:MAG TPA: bifunctional phosphoribosyl-AMP cyclohydrolase/phosphoribosyl-ATP diphosphatase HisIE [Pyrinomonadaceae bacterium]|nr:bifunctional phosphoribosyl-AMP cyclohydrolase/phosphoribosyl-ATP diphosphatase HisIE [Pyrinomonadaceae bacterium]
MKLNFDKLGGLIPAVVQDYRSNKLLMVAFMNEASFNQTMETGLATFYSRSRRAIWVKGETSGNYLHVKEVIPDCDSDTVLVRVAADGPVCHTGSQTCFDQSDTAVDVLYELADVIESRRNDPKPGSYTSQLFSEGLDRIAQKVGEESVELIIAAKNNDDDAFKAEAADLLFHYLTLLTARNVSLDEIFAVLRERRTEKGSA